MLIGLERTRLKSVTIENIVDSYDQAALKWFFWKNFAIPAKKLKHKRNMDS
jgi:hypothetical protein